MTRVRGALLVPAAVTLALAASGCASTSLLTGGSSASSTGPSTTTLLPPYTSGPAPRGAVAVIRAWARALGHGQIRAAARYFHLPSLFDDGPGQVTIRTLREAERANEELTCGAKLLRAVRHGPFIVAEFKLTHRPGGRCGAGIGQQAVVAFEIRRRRIALWLRDLPSGGGSPTLPNASPGSPDGTGVPERI
jgi:hypothetical protein